MDALLVFLLVLFEVRSGRSQNMELNCKPRHGCHLPRCDPSPVDHLGVLKRNEYPMSCVGTQPRSGVINRSGSEVTRREYNSLMSLYRRQLTEMNSLRSGSVFTIRNPPPSSGPLGFTIYKKEQVKRIHTPTQSPALLRVRLHSSGLKHVVHENILCDPRRSFGFSNI